MKKKILFINGHLNAGGVEKSLADILSHLDYSRYDVDLLLFEDYGDYAADLPEHVHIRLADLRNTFGSLTKVLPDCARRGDWFSFKMKLLLFLSGIAGARVLRFARKMLFSDMHYDVAVGFRPGVCTNIAAFAASAEKKITWWHHGEFNLSGNGARDYILACREMDHVVSVSERCAVFLRENIPALADKLTVIPNFLSPDSIQDKAERFHPYAGDDRRHIVTVGRLAPEKHVEDCLFTARTLYEQGHRDFLWHIVGDGSERARLETLAAEYGISEMVRFEGRQANPYPYLKDADLFVHASHVESQGIVILEAMLLGVPCVVTRSLGPCEFVEDGINGVLAHQNPESLAEKVVNMLTDEELYSHIRMNTHCPERFLPEQVIGKIERLIDSDH